MSSEENIPQLAEDGKLWDVFRGALSVVLRGCTFLIRDFVLRRWPHGRMVFAPRRSLSVAIPRVGSCQGGVRPNRRVDYSVAARM